MVRVGRLELPASCSQSKRATNCATPGYEVFQLWSNMWSRSFFDQLQARGKVLSTQTPQGFAGFPRVETRTWASRSQTTRATNCANPGYSIFLHDTTQRKKKQVFRVCGHARSHGSFTENRGGCSHVFIVPVSSAKSSPFRRRPLQPGRPGAPYSRIFVYYVLYFAVKPAKIFETF